jgi:UDP-N-acetylglucosamine 4,6-dehydratase
MWRVIVHRGQFFGRPRRPALFDRALWQGDRFPRQLVPLFQKLRASGKLPITDLRMTRFWITLEQGATFVKRYLSLMTGGEIFIPKIPSIRVSDLAAALAPECRQEIVGIRPGEKLHECLIPPDEARLTREFDDFYVILPARYFGSASSDSIYDGCIARQVADDFEYTSDANDCWAGKQQILDMIG